MVACCMLVIVVVCFLNHIHKTLQAAPEKPVTPRGSAAQAAGSQPKACEPLNYMFCLVVVSLLLNNCGHVNFVEI